LPSPGSPGRRLLDGFAAQAAAALDRERLRTQAAQAEAFAEGKQLFAHEDGGGRSPSRPIAA
jgi:GAF domain-containing protein